MRANPIEWIRKASFFGGLSDAACAQLAALSRHRTIAKRTPLFVEGMRGDAIYLLISGTIQLLKTSADGKESVIKTVRCGELFAEVILFEQTRYPVTAMARTAADVIEVPRAGFLNLLDEPAFRNDFMALLMAKQRYLTQRIQQLSTLDVEARFVEFLREHCGEQNCIRPELSKKDIAGAIDATPETFSRLLQKLEAAGGFRWEGSLIHTDASFWNKNRARRAPGPQTAGD